MFFLKECRPRIASHAMLIYKRKDDMKYPGYEPMQLCTHGLCHPKPTGVNLCGGYSPMHF